MKKHLLGFLSIVALAGLIATAHSQVLKGSDNAAKTKTKAKSTAQTKTATGTAKTNAAATSSTQSNVTGQNTAVPASSKAKAPNSRPAADKPKQATKAQETPKR